MNSYWTPKPPYYGALEISFTLFAHFSGLALCQDAEPRAEGCPVGAIEAPTPPSPTGDTAASGAAVGVPTPASGGWTAPFHKARPPQSQG